MRKWLRRILLCIILVFVVWAGVLYSCAVGNRKYNVLIETSKPGFFGKPSYSIGSGVVVSKNGWVLTAKHVIEDVSATRITLPDGRVFDVNDFYFDSNSDLAVIKLNTKVKFFVKISISDRLRYGNVLYGIGTAKGFLDNYISFGYVYKDKFKRLFFDDNEILLMKMKIFPGCSGGGVYHYGKFVGLMIAGTDSYGFAINSTEIKKFLDSLND